MNDPKPQWQAICLFAVITETENIIAKFLFTKVFDLNTLQVNENYKIFNCIGKIQIQKLTFFVAFTISVRQELRLTTGYDITLEKVVTLFALLLIGCHGHMIY